MKTDLCVYTYLCVRICMYTHDSVAKITLRHSKIFLAFKSDFSAIDFDGAH